MGKRLLSARQQAAPAAQPQTFKRINSKEDIFDDDSILVANKNTTNNKEKPSSAEEDTVLVRKISSSAELEAALKEASLQNRAIEALSRAHCAESLCCLIDLFKWESEEDENKREELKAKILTEYMKKGCDKEIFLPESIRDKLAKGVATLKEVKTHVINDLRFNSTLLKAIGAA